MSGDMIRAETDPAWPARLIARARTLAAARAEARRTRHPWRRAKLLWPLFTKG